ncbi:MAG: hypothetical protein V1908_04420 [Candidatus Peregrinibacteria bacterium]
MEMNAKLKRPKQKTVLKKGGIKSWILFVVLILGIFGLLYGWQQQKEGGLFGKPQPTQEENLKPGKPFATQELTEKQKAAQDQSTLHKAWTTGKLEDCEALFDETKRQTCKDQLNLSMALKGNDETLCDVLSDPVQATQCKDQIYSRSAMEELNSAFCEKIQDLSLKQNCLDRLQSLLAGQNRSLSGCEAIKDATAKTQCLNQIYYSSGVEFLDKNHCNKITSSSLQERCQATIEQNQRVIALSQNQIVRQAQALETVSSRCDLLQETSRTECQDEVNYKLALEKRDLNYCNQVSNVARRNECLTVQTGHINRFYLTQAIAKHDPALCQKILSDDLRRNCLTYSAAP